MSYLAVFKRSSLSIGGFNRRSRLYSLSMNSMNSDTISHLWSSDQFSTGQVARIPEGGREIFYRFETGEVSRRISTAGQPMWKLAHVNKSSMELDARGDVPAWLWELEVVPARKEIHLPLRFTFEAAAKAKP